MPFFLSPPPFPLFLPLTSSCSSRSPRRALSPCSHRGGGEGICSCSGPRPGEYFAAAAATLPGSTRIPATGAGFLQTSSCRWRAPSSAGKEGSALFTSEAVDPRPAARRRLECGGGGGVCSAARARGSPAVAEEVEMPPAHPDFADGVIHEDGDDEIRASSGGEGREIFYRDEEAGRPPASSPTSLPGGVIHRVRNLPGGERFQDLLLKRGDDPLSISDFNEILLTAARHGELESAELLFAELPAYGLSPNCWTFSIMIQHLCKENEPERAKEFSDEMIKSGLRPTVASFTFLVHCLCRKGKLQSAYELFEAMGRVGCRPTIQTYNCLLNGLCYVGRIEEALQLLQKIKLSPALKPDIFTFTTVIDGFCKVGRTDEAIELLNEALNSGVNPNIVTFNALVNGFCREGRPLEAAGLLREMRGGGCPPDHITYSTLLQGLMRSGEVPTALRIHAEMREAGLKPEARVINSLLRGACRRSTSDPGFLEQVEGLSEEIAELGADCISPYTYCLMVQALVNGGRSDKALTHLVEMERMGLSPRGLTYDMAIRVLCGQGRADDAVLVLAMMTRAKRIPSSYACEKLLAELNRRGRFLDACAVYAAAMKKGVRLSRQPREPL